MPFPRRQQAQHVRCTTTVALVDLQCAPLCVCVCVGGSAGSHAELSYFIATISPEVLEQERGLNLPGPKQ